VKEIISPPLLSLLILVVRSGKNAVAQTVVNVDL